MRILISGSSGLIGNALHASLTNAGHQVLRLVRNRQVNGIYWNPAEGVLDPQALNGIDAVINLSGENIAAGRWTEARKQKILKSRIDAAKTLVAAMKRRESPPKIFISGSAYGYYGDRGEEICTEDTCPGKGFLAKVCVDWENAAEKASEAGIRTVMLRFGIVLSSEGGALGKMLPLFKLCLGGKVGSGSQYMSWIVLDDIAGIVQFVLAHPTIEGAVNATAPGAVTNAAFARALGKALRRPAVLPVPAFALKVILGKQMAEEFFLNSTRAEPAKLSEAGYQFKYPSLEHALIHLVR